MEKKGGSSTNNQLEFEGKEDRISDLPDSLIELILSFLPSTKQAIQTGILSKRWQNQWTSVPVLIFYSSDNYSGDFGTFIDKTLTLHDCPKIKKFHIEKYFSDYELNLASKIHFATRKYVEELIVDYVPYNAYDEENAYKLPKFLYNNAFLVKLELTNCYFNRKWRVNWPSLKQLKLKSFVLPFAAIQKAISGSPALESLELINFNAVKGDAIVSKSLKRLSFVDVNCDDDTDHIEILCPNLEEFSVKALFFVNTNLTRQTMENVLFGCPLLRSLELSGFEYDDEFVIASNSLKKLVIGENDSTGVIEILCPNLEELKYYATDFVYLKVVNLPSSVFATLDFTSCCFESVTRQILEQFQHVKKLKVEEDEDEF
ncbi:F-box/LRR-repeat protein 25-like [Euphorbia lathyris]|uniref:F-box/LRR-repeat protein 25-like n=1 Tax=Euphorbia lathyris TaxID=212925 RepID=UPI0033142677